MAILAVGGEVDCYRVKAPNDVNQYRISNSAYTSDDDILASSFDPQFARIALRLGSPGYYLDLPAQGSRNIWLHMEWRLELSENGYDDDPGFVFMRDDVALARFRMDKTTLKVFVEISPNGIDGWEKKTPEVDNGFTDYARRERIAWDVHIFFQPSGGIIEIYKNGTMVSSYYGAMFTAYEACNRILCYQNGGFFSQLIVADEPTMDMKLLTRIIPSNTSPTSFSGGWDRNGLGPLGDDAVLLNSENFYADYFWSTGYQLESLIWEPVPLNYNYAYFADHPPIFTQEDYEVKALAIGAAIGHISGGYTTSTRFIITDGQTSSAVSQDLNTFPSDPPFIYRVQYVWNENPFSQTPWGFSDMTGLLFGVQSV